MDLFEYKNELNASSDYYSDVCYTATSDRKTDISLKDRKNKFIDDNLTYCQEDCDFSEFDSSNRTVTCSCVPKKSSLSFKDMKINLTEIYQSFIDINNIMNLNILSCYKVLLTKKGIIINFGFFSIALFVIFHLIVMIIFYAKQKEIIEKKINDIAFSINNWKLVEEKEGKEKKDKNKIDKNKKNQKSTLHTVRGNSSRKQKSQNKNKNKNFPPKKNKITKTKNKFNFGRIVKNFFKQITEGHSTIKSMDNIKKNKEEVIKKIEKIMEHNDEEKNNFPYEIAIKSDKRKFCEYYCSLLRTGHIIIFSFWYNKDYNLRLIKIDFFFINFVISYTTNALFFTDDTIHKIYEDYGYYNFFYQLPQIAYCSIICSVLNVLLRILCLSEKDIIAFKQDKTKKNLNTRLTNLRSKLNIKFILFFILALLMLLFMFYYVSVFSAVYKNTQLHLLKDTLISLGLSFLYPFVIYLIPGFLRISALSNRKNKRICLYNTCLLLQKL